MAGFKPAEYATGKEPERCTDLWPLVGLGQVNLGAVGINLGADLMHNYSVF